MEWSQLSQHVYQFSETMYFKNVKGEKIYLPVHNWLIKDKERLCLIDTGNGASADEQIRLVKQLSGRLEAIYLTHHHADHIGGLKAWLAAYEVPVYIHRLEKAALMDSQTAAFVEKHRPQIKDFQMVNSGEPLFPDVKVYHTPGHTKGHVVVHHQKDEILMVGDLFTTADGKLFPTIYRYTDDYLQNIESAAIIDAVQPKQIAASHGKAIPYSPSLFKNYQFLCGI